MTPTSPAAAIDRPGDVVLRENVLTALPAEVVERAAAEEWASVGVAVDRRLGDASDGWRVRAERLVGVAEFGRDPGGIRLRIDPKIAADHFLLADWAFGRIRNIGAETRRVAHIDVSRRDPSACLVAWYLDSLEGFVVRWLRRNFQLRTETLVGRARGHIAVGEYVSRYLATARPHHVPCQFLEASRDTLQNRILRRALSESARLIPSLPIPESRRELTRTVLRIEPFLSGVTNQLIAPGDFKRVRLGRSQRHYEPMLSRSEAFLSGLFFTRHFGAHRQRAFLWDASLLFQEALRGILGSWDEVTLDDSRGRAALLDHNGKRHSSTKVDPDYVLRGERGVFVLDAKWKDVVVKRASTTAVASDEDHIVDTPTGVRIRVRRSDVYQAVSYGRYRRHAPCSTGLVYPLALGAGDNLPEPMRVTGFGEPVWILFIDVGDCAESRFSEFFAAVSAAWSSSGG